MLLIQSDKSKTNSMEEKKMELLRNFRSDALRTFLSLSGVSIGIFVVTVSFALVDAFSRSVVAGFDHFGSDMIMVERFPVVSEEIPGQAGNDGETHGGKGAGNDTGNDWSRYASRPQPSREDYMAVAGASVTPGSTGTVTPGSTGGPGGWTAFAGASEADIVCGGRSLRGCKLVGVAGDWQHLVYSSVAYGRDFSLAELAGNDAKVIIGSKVARDLFGEKAEVCGRTVRIDGRNMMVIGVLSYEGKNIINLYATDYALIVPFGTAERIAGVDNLETMIAIGPGAAGREAAMQDARRALRASRRLKATQEDNFALNTMEDLCRETVALTRKITAAGLVIALFSLLIGGFGIVNIMLVSVKERTSAIGLKKALGAKRRHILMEFMAEALLLSVFGAVFGLLLAAGVLALVPAGVIDARLSAPQIALAFALSIVLGLVSGLAPASQASRLNPVDALRG
jgi:putative ABC transport system permease protein